MAVALRIEPAQWALLVVSLVDAVQLHLDPASNEMVRVGVADAVEQLGNDMREWGWLDPGDILRRLVDGLGGHVSSDQKVSLAEDWDRQLWRVRGGAV
jgi:hypothetical protein